MMSSANLRNWAPKFSFALPGGATTPFCLDTEVTPHLEAPCMVGGRSYQYAHSLADKPPHYDVSTNDIGSLRSNPRTLIETKISSIELCLTEMK